MTFSASGTRTRSGTATPTMRVHTFSPLASTRTRSGSAPLGRLRGFTGSTTRSRTGYAVPAGRRTATRWTLYDPLANTTYVFEKNPNDGGSPRRSRTLLVAPTTASDGTSVVFQGSEAVPTMQVKGSTFTQAAYDGLKAWFNKRYLVLLTDDLGRQMQVHLETFTPTRGGWQHNQKRHTYQLTIRVFGFGVAPFDPATAFIVQ